MSFVFIFDESTNDEALDYKFVQTSKNNINTKYLNISIRWLETIVETCRDYSRLLEEQLKEKQGIEKAGYIYKIKENNDIAEKIATDIGYCKSCKIKEEKENDIGAEAMMLSAVGYKR